MRTHLYSWGVAVCCLIFSLALGSCENHDDAEPVIAPASRTILVYMVANNNLGSLGYDISDLDEMLEAARTGGLHNGRLIVYHAPYEKAPALKEVTPDGIITLKEYDRTLLSVSAERMKQVIADTKAIAPASDYGIVLWSHASGWLQTGIDEPQMQSQSENNTVSPLAYGSDKDPDNIYRNMNITTLASVLDGEGFSFVYCDCCYMASVEVAYELRNATSYIIASTTELPANGMRYDLNIPLLLKDGEPDLIGCARNTYQYYSSLAMAKERTCTMSVISTAGLENLASATRAIYESGAKVSDAYVPQQFEIGYSCHYFDLANYITSFETTDGLKSDWLSALDKVVIYKANTPYIWNMLEISHHSGLSTYPLSQPSQASIDGYSELQWYNDVAAFQL